MNFFKLTSLILVIAVTTIVAAPNKKKCGENEEFLECGTACEANCAEGHVMFCTMQCIVNVCQCKNGFFRNKEKKRENNVTGYQSVGLFWPLLHQTVFFPNDSFLLTFLILVIAVATIVAAPRKECEENEGFLQCGTACEPNCAKEHMCTMQCIARCQCKDEFFRNTKNKCVPRNKC